MPSYIPTSAHDMIPDFKHISRSASESNLKRLRKYALLDVDYTLPTSNSMPSSHTSGAVNSGSNGAAAGKNITTSIAQQEKEFQKAVQPGSPISALLSSARQPLLMGNAGVTSGAGGGVRESPLLRKLQAVKESPLGRRSVTRGLDGVVEERENPMSRRRMPAMPGSQDDADQHEEEEMRLRKKELEAQKARIVAQMAPVREEVEHERDEDQEPMRPAPPPPVTKPKEKLPRERYMGLDRENVAPVAQVQPAQKYGSLRTREQATMRLVDKENVATGKSALLDLLLPRI